MIRNETPLPEDARILVIRMSALGDVVFGLPVIESLRAAYPKAHLAWLVEDRFASLLEGHPAIDELLVFPRKRKSAIFSHLLRMRRHNKWDAIIDLQGNLKSGMHLVFSKAKRKIGFAKGISREGAWRFLTHRVTVRDGLHRSRRDLCLLKAFQSAPDSIKLESADSNPFAWPLPDAATDEMAAAMKSAGLHDAPFFLLHTAFTDYGKDKEWPPEKWAELAQRLRAEGHNPLALWTPNDLAHVQKIQSLAGDALPLAPATPSLHHLMALLDAAQCVIGTDSGPVHLAAKRNTQTIALFGPTDPVRFSPPGPTTIVYGFGDATPPTRDRSQRSPRMDAIKVNDVIAAL